MSTTHWYVSQDDIEMESPLTYQQVMELMKTQPNARYLVWQDGMASWEDPHHLETFKEKLNPSIRLGIESAKGISQLLNADDWSAFFRGESQTQKHLALTAILTFLFSVGAISLLPEALFKQAIWTGIVAGFVSVIPCYFVSGRAISGHWPHLELVMRLTRAVLGPTRCLRRRMIYSFIGPIMLLPASLTINGHPDIAQSIVVYSIFWFFLGFYSRWESILTKPVLIPNLECGAYTFRKKVLARFKSREIPGLIAEDIKFVEPDYSSSMGFIQDGESEYILQLTINRARLIIKVKEQGNFLFIRWESFILRAQRRVFLILLLVYELLENLIYRWTGSNLKEIYYYVLHILFDWNPMVTIGNTAAGSSTERKLYHLPSHVVDSLFTLERAANIIIDDCLAEEYGDEIHLKPQIPTFSSFLQEGRAESVASRP